MRCIYACDMIAHRPGCFSAPVILHVYCRSNITRDFVKMGFSWWCIEASASVAAACWYTYECNVHHTSMTFSCSTAQVTLHTVHSFSAHVQHILVITGMQYNSPSHCVGSKGRQGGCGAEADRIWSAADGAGLCRQYASPHGCQAQGKDHCVLLH